MLILHASFVLAERVSVPLQSGARKVVPTNFVSVPLQSGVLSWCPLNQ